MKLEIQLVEQTKTPPGVGKPGASIIIVEATLNQHGAIIPYSRASSDGPLPMEHLIPWARIIGVSRERTQAK